MTLSSFQRSFSIAATAIALGVPSLHAGGISPIQKEILFVTDPVLDQVFMCRDYNHDGRYFDFDEVHLLYDDTIGSIPLDDPDCIQADPDDTLFVGDRTRRIVLAINDRDGDGDCHDAGEHILYFDGDPTSPTFNAAGIAAQSIRSVGLRVLNRLFVATSSTTPGAHSAILLLEDHNADGDANDVGESVEYYVPAPGGAPGDCVPAHIEVGNDGNVYFLEASTSGARARGIYKLVDLNGSGTIDLPTEVTLFLALPALPATPVLSSFGQDNSGTWTILDRGNAALYHALDLDASGSIDIATEFSTFWSSVGGAELPWDIAVSKAFGDVYLGDDQPSPLNNDRMWRFVDVNSDGFINPVGSEVIVSYDDTIQPVDLEFTRGLTLDFHGHEGVGTVVCSGDAGFCPCGNGGTSETGCANSTGFGAGLEGEGTDGVTNDDLVFTAFQIRPGALGVLFQGNALSNGGQGVPFGDGVVCVGGSVVRLGSRFGDALGLASWGPGLAMPGNWVAGQTRYFQVRYRNINGPCFTNFNYTNALMVTFTM